MYRVDPRPRVLVEEPPPRGLPTPVRWIIGIVVAALIGGIAAAGATAIVIFQEYPAHVSAPDMVLGLPKADDVTRKVLASERLDDGRTVLETRFVQAYADPQGRKIVVVAVGGGLVLRPARDLAASISLWASPFPKLGEVTDVPPGELGGSAACLNAKTSKDELVVFCGWADHGSVGVVSVLGAKDRDEAARWMLDIREAVVTR